jgi:WD40 repeat protein
LLLPKTLIASHSVVKMTTLNFVNGYKNKYNHAMQPLLDSVSNYLSNWMDERHNELQRASQEILESERGQLQKEKDALRAEYAHLQRMKEEFEQEKALLKDLNERTSGMIELNVGGTLLTTSRKTLCSVPGSRLEALFSGNYVVEKDKDGRIFLDREPNYFKYVLNWLREPRQLRLPNDVDELHNVLVEFDYWGIPLQVTGHGTVPYNPHSKSNVQPTRVPARCEVATEPTSLSNARKSRVMEDLDGERYPLRNLYSNQSIIPFRDVCPLDLSGIEKSNTPPRSESGKEANSIPSGFSIPTTTTKSTPVSPRTKDAPIWDLPFQFNHPMKPSTTATTTPTSSPAGPTTVLPSFAESDNEMRPKQLQQPLQEEQQVKIPVRRENEVSKKSTSTHTIKVDTKDEKKAMGMKKKNIKVEVGKKPNNKKKEAPIGKKKTEQQQEKDKEKNEQAEREKKEKALLVQLRGVSESILLVKRQVEEYLSDVETINFDKFKSSNVDKGLRKLDKLFKKAIGFSETLMKDLVVLDTMVTDQNLENVDANIRVLRKKQVDEIQAIQDQLEKVGSRLKGLQKQLLEIKQAEKEKENDEEKEKEKKVEKAKNDEKPSTTKSETSNSSQELKSSSPCSIASTSNNDEKVSIPIRLPNLANKELVTSDGSSHPVEATSSRVRIPVTVGASSSSFASSSSSSGSVPTSQNSTNPMQPTVSVPVTVRDPSSESSNPNQPTIKTASSSSSASSTGESNEISVTLNNVNTFKSEGGQVFCVHVQEDEHGRIAKVISGGKDKIIRIWDAAGNLIRKLEGHNSFVRGLDVRGNRLLSASFDNTVRLWNLDTGECIKTLNEHTDHVTGVRFLDAEGTKAASCSFDQTVKIWDLTEGKCLHTLHGHVDLVRCLAVVDEDTIVTGSEDRTMKVWNVKTGDCLQTLTGHVKGVNSVQVIRVCGHDGGGVVRIVSASDDKTIKLWDLQTGQYLRTMQGHKARINALQVVFNGRLVVSGSDDDTIKFWDMETGNCVKTVASGHKDDVTCLYVLHDSRTLVSGSFDKTVKLWELVVSENNDK